MKMEKAPNTADDVSAKVAMHMGRMGNGGASGGHASPSPQEIAGHASMPDVITSMTAK